MKRRWSFVLALLLAVAAAAVSGATDDSVTARVDVREYVFAAGAVTAPATTTATDKTEHFTVAVISASVPAPGVWLYRPHPNSPVAMAEAATAAAGGDAALDRNSVYPEEMIDSAYGLTALQCDSGIRFDSIPPAAAAAAAGAAGVDSAVDSWLVPLEPIAAAPSTAHSALYQLIASLVGENGLVVDTQPIDRRQRDQHSANGVRHLHFALLLTSVDANGRRARPAGGSAAILSTAQSAVSARTNVTGNGAVHAAIGDWMTQHCELQFLHPTDQRNQRASASSNAWHGPTGVYARSPPHREPIHPHHKLAVHDRVVAAALTGITVPLSGKAVPVARLPPIVTTAKARLQSAVGGGGGGLPNTITGASDRLQSGLNAVSEYMYGRYGAGGERHYRRVCSRGAKRRVPNPNEPDPRDLLTDDDDADVDPDADADDAAVDGLSAAERTRIGRGDAFASVDEAYFELVPLVKPILNGLLPPVKELMVETMGSVLGFFEGRGLGGVIEMGLTDLIPKHLYKKLEGPIGHRMPPGIAEAVVDLLPPLVSTATRDYVVQHLTPKITEALTIKLDKALSQSIPFKVENPYTSDLTRQLSLDLGHMLSKSLPHTLVPSLVHSLTHSPLTDYYCYYCHAEKRYCQYCTYEPKQAYYSMYYAGYYSTYYADYYSRYYANVAKARNDRRRSDDIQYLAANEHYEIVLDPSDEDSKLMS